MKNCRKCNAPKPPEMFDRRRRDSDERIAVCKECNAQRRRELARTDPVERKFCFRCKEMRSASEYHKNRSTRDGLQAYCKPCAADMQREYEARNRELLALRRAKKLLEPISATRTKTCKICGEEKPLLEFWANRGTKDRRAIYCKPCSREYDRQRRAKDTEKYRRQLREWREANPDRQRELMRSWNLHVYGITPDDYLAMYESQGGVCKICGELGESFGGRRLHVDHDHNSGHVRGLLCGLCNSALGKFKDSVDLLNAAIQYLEVAQTRE